MVPMGYQDEMMDYESEKGFDKDDRLSKFQLVPQLPNGPCRELEKKSMIRLEYVIHIIKKVSQYFRW